MELGYGKDPKDPPPPPPPLKKKGLVGGSKHCDNKTHFDFIKSRTMVYIMM